MKPSTHLARIMTKRIAFFAYGLVCYAVFFVTFLYAIAFVGGFGVPATLDGPATAPLAQGIAINAALLGVFAIQHSVMARRWFKERWTKIIPPALERSTYVLLASLALILLFWQWRPLGGVVWEVHDPVARAVLYALFAFGFTLVLVATFLINHFDLFGLRQVWLYLTNKPYTKPQFGTPVLYRVVRHPLYLGFLFAFWATPKMTFAHLLFAVATTAYILIAIQFEERDLIHEHGQSYEQYRQRVPMIVPFLRRAGITRERAARIGAAAFLVFFIKGLVWLAVAAAVVWR
jgi:protein-S-isoprenylcysteine O-methyltransferase Ste14